MGLNRIELSAEDFDRYAKLAEDQGITSAEYLKRALDTYARYHHPKVDGKLHACVSAVACSQCGSAIGEPCQNSDERRLDRKIKYSLDTHYVRRNAYKAIRDEARRRKRQESSALGAEKERAKREKHENRVQAVKDRVAASSALTSMDGHSHDPTRKESVSC